MRRTGNLGILQPLVTALAALASASVFSADPYIDWKIDFDDASIGSNQGHINVNLGEDGYWSDSYAPTVQWRLTYRNDTDFQGLGIQYKYVNISIDSTKAPGPGVVTNQLDALKPGLNHVLAHVAYANQFMAAGPDTPKAVCNQKRQALLSQGERLADILANTHVIDVTPVEKPTARLLVGYQASPNGPTLTTQRTTYLPLRIRCYGNATIARKFLPSADKAIAFASAESFKVLSAALAVSPKIYRGNCPKKLTLALSFTTNKPGPVEARVRSTRGWVSKPGIYHAGTYSPSKGVWYGEGVQTLTVPTPGPAVGGSGGGVVGQGVGTLGMQQQGGDDTFPGGQGGATVGQPGGAYSSGTPDNVHQGGLQLAVSANGKTVYSEGWQEYKVTCQPTGAVAVPKPKLAQAAAPARAGTIVSNLKPDITTQGITLNGSFVSGGPVTTISASQAKAIVNGQCRFEMAYHMINKGDVGTSPAFRNRLLRNGVPVVQHDNQSLGAKQSRVKTFNVYLQPGMNDFGLYLDVDKQVAESSETNNFRIARINLTGSCTDKIVAPASRSNESFRRR